MKYYIYISDAKVDMLLPQVPHDVQKKVSTDFGFDMKILKATRKTEAESDDTRISRLEAVLSFIREYGKVGSVDKPDDYIDDTQAMWFGPFVPADIAYFTGRTDRTIFGLSGSAHHLMGGDPNKSRWPNRTSLLNIFAWLSEQNPSHDGDGMTAIPALEDIAANSKRPKQTLEFLAKRLVYEPHFKWKDKVVQVLLATPLYVAMTD